MAHDSVIAAVEEVYNALSAAPFPGGVKPRIYFDQPPLVDGVQVRPPYVVLIDRGGVPQFDMERNAIESGGFALDVFADTLAACDQIVKAAKYGGQGPGLGAGIDFAVLPLNPPAYPMRVVRGSEQRSVAGVGVDGQRTHRCTVEYTTVVEVRA